MTTPQERAAETRFLTKIRNYMYPDGGHRSASERGGVLHGSDVERHEQKARELYEAFAAMTDAEGAEWLCRAFPDKWIELKPHGPTPAGDVGGDYQAGEAWGRRFCRQAPDVPGEWLVVDAVFYVEDPSATGWAGATTAGPSLTCRVVYTRCTDLAHPGDSEVYEDSRFHQVHGELTDDHARALCAAYSADSIGWDGERLVHGPIDRAAILAKPMPSLLDSGVTEPRGMATVRELSVVVAHVSTGDLGAPMATFAVGTRATNALLGRVYVSPNDGAIVVQLDPDTGYRHVRVTLGDKVLIDGTAGALALRGK